MPHNNNQKITSDGRELAKILGKNRTIWEEKTLATLLSVYIVGEIDEAEEYLEVFDKIRSAGELDIIRIHINSPGGYLHTAIQFMRCMRESRAKIVISVEGECMSAATLLMLNGHEFEISPHSLVMCHTYSTGMRSKGNEIRDRVKFDDEWSKKLFAEAYEGFMTQEEITAMIDGKDFWFTAEQTVERIGRRLAHINAAEEVTVPETALVEKPKRRSRKTPDPINS